MVHYRGGRAAIDPAVYPELDAFWADLTAAYARGGARLGELGCTYLQLDDTSLAYLNDPRSARTSPTIGGDPEHQHEEYIRHINEALAGRPEGMTVTTHMCRGNFRSAWAAEGGYDFVAEALLNQLDVDGFFMEWDDERSGGFEPLRFLPKGDKRVVLGLVTTKSGVLESKDELKRRIEEAAKYVAARPALPVAAVRLLVDRRGQRADRGRAVGEAAARRRGRRRGLGQHVTVCSSCGAENRTDAKFCGGCGVALAAICSACNTPNEAGRKFCYECGAPLGAVPAATAVAESPREAPAAERRLVSVLFADLVGFTTLSESRDAEEVRELLSRYFDTCRRLIGLYGGTVEKFIGDAVMAVWGTPTATEDDAERAVRAALDLVAAVSALGTGGRRRGSARASRRAHRRGRRHARRRGRGDGRGRSRQHRLARAVGGGARARCSSASRRAARPSRRSSTRMPARSS